MDDANQAKGGDRITTVFFDGSTVSVGTLQSLNDVSEYIQIHSGAQVWVDIRTSSVAPALGALGVEDPGPGPIIHEIKDPLQTVIAYTHTVRHSRKVHRTVLAAKGPDVLISIHDSFGKTDSKQMMLKYIQALVEKELGGVPKAILYFRNMLMTALLDSQADEYITTLQGIVKELSDLHQRLDMGEADTKEVQSELFRTHMFIEDEFPSALLSFREVVAKLRMGAGKNFDLSPRQHELEETLREVDVAVEIKANVEKTVDLVNHTLHVKLTERSIETQSRLQRAVWLLTHLSVLLIIPNLVLAFWRLTPWIGETKVAIGGVEIHAFWFSIIATGLLTLLSLVALNSFLRRHIGQTFEEAIDDPGLATVEDL
jgi:ferredoxin-fold anticodon binding domain-containing protein